MKTGDRRQETVRGMTIEEVDAYYEGLLKEIEELEELLKEGDNGQESGQEDNKKG